MWFVLLAASCGPSADESPSRPGTPTGGTTTEGTTDTTEPGPSLWVSDYLGERVVVVDPVTGRIRERIAPVPGAQSTQPWSGGWLIAAEVAGEVLSLEVDGALRPVVTGAGSPTAAIEVGGELLVADFAGDTVTRYDPATGASLGVLASGLDGPDAGMVLGPDGKVWVPLFEGDQVVRIDPTSGDVEPFAEVPGARGIVFGADVVYVSAWKSDAILRFDLAGTRLDDLAAVGRPTGLALEPGGAAVWVASDQHGRLLRLDTASGAELASLEPRIEGGTFLTWSGDAR